MGSSLEKLVKFRNVDKLPLDADKKRYVKYLDEDVLIHYVKVKSMYEISFKKFHSLERECDSVTELTHDFKFMNSYYKQSVFEEFKLRYKLKLIKYDLQWTLFEIYQNFQMISELYKEIQRPHRTELENQPLIDKFERLLYENKELIVKLHEYQNGYSSMKEIYSRKRHDHYSAEIKHIKAQGNIKDIKRLLQLQITTRFK